MLLLPQDQKRRRGKGTKSRGRRGGKKKRKKTSKGGIAETSILKYLDKTITQNPQKQQKEHPELEAE